NEYARLLQDEIRQYFQSGKTLAKDWLARAKGWTDRLGGTAYGLGYSFNLLMAVFVEAPWSVIRDATPVLIDGK
ncbi:hypothetical protein A262_16380, partial [Pseudomonas syringae pv. actinidiae ICMP 19073]